MFDKSGGNEDTSDKEKTPVKQGGVPGVVTQDQIDEMVKKAKVEPSKEKPSSATVDSSKNDDGSDLNTGSAGGKLSQDQISAMFDKSGGNEDTSDKEKTPVKQGGVPGVVTQDQISDMVQKAKSEKNKDSKTKKEVEPADNSSDKDASPGGKIGQDDINKMIKKMKKEKEKK
jgi:hypothetical protein